MRNVLSVVSCALALYGCCSFFGDPYPETIDEGFVSLADESAMRAKIAAGENIVLRYEFLTSAPFGGEGVLPALADNTGKQIWGKDKNYAGNGSYVRKDGMWNFSEVKLIDGQLEVYVNGYLVTTADKVSANTKWIGFQGKEQYRNIRAKVLPECAKLGGCPCQHLPCPAGFTAYYNGNPEQLKTMWKGVTTEGKFDNPFVRQAATKEERERMQVIADKGRDEHWHIRNGVLYFDGFKGGYSLATKKNYGDFEMWADWRIMSITGDSGFYLRGSPQVQIWDAHNQWHIGSGGLYNNQKNPSKALAIADNLVGDWNRFHVIMRGDKVTVWLNGVLVVDKVTLENYWDRSKPIFPIEQIELQCHGDPTEWRNIFIKEL